jgi:hypothetical protein
MDDHIRISDADRDRVAGRLRDSFAEGRLTADELDERVTATLGAKTIGELRRVTADLPQPASPPPPPGQFRPGQFRPGRFRPAPYWQRRYRGRRFLPLVALALAVALIAGGGWTAFFVLRTILLLWLVVMVAGFVASGRFRRRMRRGRGVGPAGGRP